MIFYPEPLCIKKNKYDSNNDNLPPIVASSYQYIRDFKKLALEHNYQYIVVTLPSIEGDGSQFTEIINIIKNDKINYYDTSFITPLFTAKQYHATTYDWHPSALVHHKIGEMLSAYILNNFLGKACPKKLVRFYPDRNNRICSGHPLPAKSGNALPGASSAWRN